MEVIFGVQARDGALRVQIPDEDVAALKKDIDAAIGSDAKVLWVTDKDGKEYGIPSDKIAFIEFASEKAASRVGFAS
jgi:hypothetical protein